MSNEELTNKYYKQDLCMDAGRCKLYHAMFTQGQCHYYNEWCELKDKVADLEAKLAEKDRKIERLKQDYDEVWEDTLFRVKEDFELNNNCNECRRYYAEEFNKQLTELEKKNDKLGTDLYNAENILSDLQQQLAEKEKELAYMTKQAKKFNNEAQKYFEDACCNDSDNQDKISFAVEKLKETQIYVDNQHFMSARYKCEKKVYADIWNFIDNQIKQLKEVK